MDQGVPGQWWEHTSKVNDEMTYTCDSKLGSPAATDCIKLLSQLPPGSDKIELGPGNVRFLTLSKLIENPTRPIFNLPCTNFSY